MRVEKATGSGLAQMASQSSASLSVSCRQSGLSHDEPGQHDAGIAETDMPWLFIDPLGLCDRI